MAVSFKHTRPGGNTVVSMTKPSVTLDAISIVTSDLAASLAFYRLLGLAVPAGSEDEPHVEYRLDGGLRVLWDTVETVQSFDPDWRPAENGPAMSMAFDCGSAEGVDATVETLRTAGHPVRSEPWDAFWGQRYAVLLDPDGNSVDLFAALS